LLANTFSTMQAIQKYRITNIDIFNIKIILINNLFKMSIQQNILSIFTKLIRINTMIKDKNKRLKSLPQITS